MNLLIEPYLVVRVYQGKSGRWHVQTAMTSMLCVSSWKTVKSFASEQDADSYGRSLLPNCDRPLPEWRMGKMAGRVVLIAKKGGDGD